MMNWWVAQADQKGPKLQRVLFTLDLKNKIDATLFLNWYFFWLTKFIICEIKAEIYSFIPFFLI